MQRRDFLKCAAGATVGSSIVLAGQASASSLAGGRRLILVELDGANDGLNTLVPWQDDDYRRARPSLALGRNKIIDVTPELGLHASLKPLMRLLEKGELSVVQGLGYPTPNRSHFSSSAFWHTGGDGQQGRRRAGWITHDIQHRFADAPVHGVSLVDVIGPFDSPDGRWLTASSVAQLAALSVPEQTSEQGMPNALDRVANRIASVDRMLGRVRAQLDRAPSIEKFPGDKFGAQLREVTRFIGAGLSVPVYRVKLTGFDTHANQLARHDRLLKQFAQGIAALRRELIALGEWNNTLVVTHSEFGRRVAENHSGGTDHGTAAPQMIAGGGLATDQRLLGQAPDLVNLVDDDPVATLDYRALYEQVLSAWFDIDDNQFKSYRQPVLQGVLQRA